MNSDTERVAHPYVSCSRQHSPSVKVSFRTHRMWRARCSLLVKLNLHGGNSVQKNFWPFFFFVGRPSPSTLSLSDPPPPPSPSESAISTSCESVEGAERCESSRWTVASRFSTFAGCVEANVFWNGDVGKGRCPLTPPKLALVGVVGADWVVSSAGRVASGFKDGGAGARGVVGVDASMDLFSARPNPTEVEGNTAVMIAVWLERLATEECKSDSTVTDVSRCRIESAASVLHVGGPVGLEIRRLGVEVAGGGADV